jgi:beta-galactosidase
MSTDHYLVGEGPATHVDLAFAADLTRSLAGRRSWLLMEHSTSAVNWQPRNLAKVPGQLIRNSLAHVARGSDGAMFFQWRQSAAGAEKWHSAMLPHGGTDTAVWREVVDLGALLAGLGEVAGGVPTPEVAILLDYPSIWAQDDPAQPSIDMEPRAILKEWHAALWRAGITVDFAHPEQDLSHYKVVLVPALYLVTDTAAANLTAFVAAGGTALVGPYSGIVDEHDRVRLGGYPGAWRDLLGVHVRQHFPLPSEGTVELSDGSTGLRWREDAEAVSATVEATYTQPPVAGAAAITRRAHGDGAAWYVGTHPGPADLQRLLTRVVGEAGVRPTVDAPTGVEAVRRAGRDGVSYLFLLNHTAEQVDVAARGTLIPGETSVAGTHTLAPGAVAVIREQAAPDGSA